MQIEIENYLRVHGYGQKSGKKYVRISLPIAVSEGNDIRQGDLVKIRIEEHIKVGRNK